MLRKEDNLLMAEDEGRRCLVIGMKYDGNINRRRGRKMDGEIKSRKKYCGTEREERRMRRGEWV